MKWMKNKHPFKPKPKDLKKPSVESTKQIYSTKPGVVPDNLDAIVIGSGIGGLSIAAFLAQEGRRVLVVEQHDVAGGCCHVFEEKGYEFDTGIHYIGNMDHTKPSSSLKVLNSISNNQLKWESMGDIYDISIIEGDKVEWKRDNSKTIEYLNEKFPDEKEKIKKYFELVKEVSSATSIMFLWKIVPTLLGWYLYYFYGGVYNKYRSKTVKEVLQGELKMSEKLATTLCYLSGDYGILPQEAPFPIQALVCQHYIRSGAYYPVGGPSAIAETIIPTIEATGGKVLVKCEVQEILINSKMEAYGIKTSKGEILAPLIISSAGVFNTYGKLLKKDIQEKINVPKLLKGLEPSMTHFYLFLGMKKDSKDLSLPSTNYWIHQTYDTEKYYENYRKKKDFSFCGAFISFPSSKDPTYSKRYPNKSTCVCVAEAEYDWVKEYSELRVKQRGSDYQDFKDQVQSKLLEIVLKHFPQIKDEIEYIDVATPVTNDYYLGSYKGSSYGIKYKTENEKVIPQTPIKNLYLSGQDVSACGFTGALGGALLCYGSITGNNYTDKL